MSHCSESDVNRKTLACPECAGTSEVSAQYFDQVMGGQTHICTRAYCHAAWSGLPTPKNAEAGLKFGGKGQ